MRAEAEGLVLDLDDELLALLPAERRVVGRQHVLHDAPDLLLDGFLGQQCELREVEALDELAVDPGLEIEVRRLTGALGLAGGAVVVVINRGGLGAAPSLEKCHVLRSWEALGIPDHPQQ